MKIQSLQDKERLDWLRLSRTERIGPHTFFQLLKLHGCAAKALQALPDMARRGGAKRPLVAFPLAKAQQELEALSHYGATLIAACEPDYPDALRHIPDPPPLLTVLGDPAVLQRAALAIVGARNASANAMRFTGHIAKTLAKDYRRVIVSGLARGIDTAAHSGALEAGEDTTVAVIAGGINDIYPKENTALYERIAKGGGCIVAESSFGHPPRAHDFPRRNRIISGLSEGTLVVEATKKSGSLITAERASDQGREVMAVPGFPLDPRAGGPNKLIKQGAALIESVDDIIHTLNYAELSRIPSPLEEGDQGDFIAAPPSESDYARVQSVILEQLSTHPVQLDDLIAACEAPAQTVQAVLLELELAGRIERQPGGYLVAVYAPEMESC